MNQEGLEPSASPRGTEDCAAELLAGFDAAKTQDDKWAYVNSLTHADTKTLAQALGARGFAQKGIR